MNYAHNNYDKDDYTYRMGGDGPRDFDPEAIGKKLACIESAKERFFFGAAVTGWQGIARPGSLRKKAFLEVEQQVKKMESPSRKVQFLEDIIRDYRVANVHERTKVKPYIKLIEKLIEEYSDRKRREERPSKSTSTTPTATNWIHLARAVYVFEKMESGLFEPYNGKAMISAFKAKAESAHRQLGMNRDDPGDTIQTGVKRLYNQYQGLSDRNKGVPEYSDDGDFKRLLEDFLKDDLDPPKK